MSDPEIKTDNEIKDETAFLTCSICGEQILPDPVTKWSGGNNAEPINSGRCCNECNTSVVIPTRMKRMGLLKD